MTIAVDWDTKHQTKQIKQDFIIYDNKDVDGRKIKKKCDEILEDTLMHISLKMRFSKQM